MYILFIIFILILICTLLDVAINTLDYKESIEALVKTKEREE